jgi:F-type H+-transporting ATPase subunit epsilon
MLHLEILTPGSTTFEGEALSLTFPTPDGEITVLSDHMPLMTIVSPGSITVRTKQEEKLFAVSRGVAEINGNHVRLLADTADRAEDLEEGAIEKAKEEAKRVMSERSIESEEFAAATAILERELARLNVVKRHRSRRSL